MFTVLFFADAYRCCATATGNVHCDPPFLFVFDHALTALLCPICSIIFLVFLFFLRLQCFLFIDVSPAALACLCLEGASFHFAMLQGHPLGLGTLRRRFLATPARPHRIEDRQGNATVKIEE